MNCRNCNQEIDGNTKFCPNCGTQQNIPAGEVQTPPVQEEQPFTQTPPIYSQAANTDYTGYGNTNNTYQNQEKPVNTTTYMVFSILTTICCCLPLGIVSIVFASKISTAQKTGMMDEARDYAKNAKIFMIIGVAIGAVINVLWFIGFLANLGAGYYY